jgi:hypothetical protein
MVVWLAHGLQPQIGNSGCWGAISISINKEPNLPEHLRSQRTAVPLNQLWLLIISVVGVGEVSMVYRTAVTHARVQGSVMAGLWRVRHLDESGQETADTLEVAYVPRLNQRLVQPLSWSPQIMKIFRIVPSV